MSQQTIYLAMTGLSATLDRMTASTNNLANANTTAFKAQQPVFRAQPLTGQGLADRVNVATGEDTADFKAGPIEQTGRSLDVAVKGSGWIGVQASDGGVALTRNGSLSISPSGLLQISGALVGQSADQVAAINRILLTNPPAATLKRRADGLFQDQLATPAADASVQLQIGSLEGSNANPVATMMSMIENTRMFQMQTELVKLVTSTGQGQSSPLTLS